jgi:sugar O-acyltransferase (sialic acid O-acetyltransferase NeuD family)
MERTRKRVLVWGAGGHGKVVVDAILCGAEWEIGGVIDEDPRKDGSEVLGAKVMLFEGDLLRMAQSLRCEYVAIAIGNNYTRNEKFEMIRSAGLAAATVVHPSAHVSRFVKIGEGVIILAGATINAGTVMEDNVCVNTAASVDHDNYLEHSCHIFPNATLTGSVHVGEFAYVGAGAVIKPNVTVQKYSYVGAGAVVLDDVPEGKIVCGVPAQITGEQTRRMEMEKR